MTAVRDGSPEWRLCFRAPFIHVSRGLLRVSECEGFLFFSLAKDFLVVLKLSVSSAVCAQGVSIVLQRFSASHTNFGDLGLCPLFGKRFSSNLEVSFDVLHVLMDSPPRKLSLIHSFSFSFVHFVYLVRLASSELVSLSLGMSGESSGREEGMGYDDHDAGTDEPSTEFYVVRPPGNEAPEVEEVGTSIPEPSRKGKEKKKAGNDKPEDRDIKTSRCTLGFLRAVRAAFGIPKEYELSVIPKGKRLNDVPPENTIMLTLEHLQSGIRFPISEQYQRLSDYFEVPLSQIHPNGVRHYSCFLKLCQQNGVTDSMRLFCCMYLMSLKDQSHFAYLRFRGERKDVPGGLVSGITDSLRDFKEDYFQISHPTAFQGMVTTWVTKCYKPLKWFHIPGPMERDDMYKLRDAAPAGEKAHADDLSPKVPFDYWKSSAPASAVNSLDPAKLAGKKRKRPATRASTLVPPAVPRAAADAASGPRPTKASTAAPEGGIHVVPLRVQLPSGVDIPPTAEPVGGNIPFVDLGSAETVVGPREAEEVPREAAPGVGGSGAQTSHFQMPDLPDVSSDSSTAASGPDGITRARFAEWVGQHNPGVRVSIHELPIAGDIARVTTLPEDEAYYKTYKPENLLATVSALCIQAAQMSYRADRNASQNEDDLLLAKRLLLAEAAKVRDAEKRAGEAERRASEAEKRASDGASLVAKLEDKLRSSEDRRAEDLDMLEKLRGENSRLENEHSAAKDDFAKQLSALTTRNELASKGLRETVADQKKKLTEMTKRAEDAEAEVAKGVAREEGLYEDFRRMLYIGEVQVGEFVKGRFGADVDVSDFKLDVLELHRRAKELPEDYDVPADIEDYLADDQDQGPN
ncbi:uncharacterized protein LOC126665545 [Mercurialis annua]|uniref:uncharacterized protein LOC126665545 n=1 Tax=Mercurialis annua TaxID=3986 RepID=UPI0024AFACBB|nr:uncharacterized protein LOC126665545 [Mercurialis annua]